MPQGKGTYGTKVGRPPEKTKFRRAVDEAVDEFKKAKKVKNAKARNKYYKSNTVGSRR